MKEGSGHAFRVGILGTHPVQYYAPWYRELARHVDLQVFFAHGQSPAEQAKAGFGVAFDWDIPLLEGYSSRFLENRARRPSVSTFGGCDTPEIRRVIKENRFDAFIVHGWYNRSYWQAIRACWETRTPVLVRGDSRLGTRRFLLWRALKKFLYRSFIPRFDGYLTVGRRAREYYLHYGADARRMFFSPHAVDNGFFARSAGALRGRRGELRERWRIPNDAVVYLFAGKLIPKKRPLDFAHAVGLASNESRRVWGLMVGDGALRGDVEAFLTRSNSPLRLAGFLNQSEMPRAYATADALVLTSESETWGLVVNEAMASGIPAIVNEDAGCVPDLIRRGQTGFSFRSGDVEELAALMRRCAAARSLPRLLGAGAFRHIALYSIENAARGALSAVESLEGGFTRSAARV